MLPKFVAQYLLLAAAFGLAIAGVARAQPAAGKIHFDRDIQPLLAKRCFSCHGPDKAEGGLRLSSQESAQGTLESGARGIVPGKPEASEVLRRVTSSDESERMPPEGKPLSADETDRIRRWIADGAPWQQHWSFQPPRPQAVPQVKNRSWTRNPIDAFILAGLEENNLAPNRPVDSRALIRRATYDLTGLPPTPEEVEEFAAHFPADAQAGSNANAEQAYRDLIERLLASPRYGERWARHWLDVVRYADTNSFERDGVKPHAWRYRDYVIRSFNDDKPYDQFVREQLAGDELAEVTNDSMIATGYYRLGLWDDEPADRLQARYDVLDDLVATTGQVFLGLTVNCARCHDHKIDPILQRDYYGLLAFFHNITSNGTKGPNVEAPLFENSAERLAYEEQLRKLEQQRDQVQAELTAIETRFKTAYQQSTATKVQSANLNNIGRLIKSRGAELLGQDEAQRYQHLQKKLNGLKNTNPPADFALVVTEYGSQAPDTFILQRGNAHVPGEKVGPRFPGLLGGSDVTIATPDKGSKTAGRRIELAHWIASDRNWLTARVMVNRLWQHHFGRGIVRSPNNFGQLGDPPTQPELLDWLAQQFVAGGWRMKDMHRRIMLSNTYRMSSAANPVALAKDPTNNLFWRFDMRRLSAEEIRDSIHAISGRLKLEMYGPGVYPEISAEVLAGQSHPGAGWRKSSADEQARRSIYIHVKRSLITPLLADFDFAETDSSCAARFATTQPTQALGMLNGAFVNAQAAEFAKRLRREAKDDPPAQVRRALELALCRPPDAASIHRGLALMKSLVEKHGQSREAALDYFCLMVLNLNEFVYLD